MRMLSRRDIYPLLFLCLAAFLLLSPAVLTGGVYFLRDITYIFHPWRVYGAELLQRGEMPLWNPYAYCGMPFLANWQSALFYPPNLLFVFFSFRTALLLFYALHLVLAGVFAYLFARRAGFGRAGASGMMLVFALNGFLVTKLEFLSHVSADVWLFALLLFARSPLLLGLTAALCFFAGHQAFFFCLAVLFLYLAFTARRPTLAADARNLVLSGLIAAGVTAVQLIPTAELVARSERSAKGISAGVSMLYSLTPRDLAGFVSPLFSPSSVPAEAGERFPWSTTNAVGLIAALLAVRGLLKPGDGRVRFWAAALVVTGVLLAMGHHTPVYPWLYRHLPPLHLIRYPAQFAFLAVAGLAVLAGRGLAGVRGRAVVAALIGAELVLTFWNFQPVAPGDFFAMKPAAAACLQRQDGNNRFILTPGTEKNRALRGPDLTAVWQQARGHLYNLVSVPYHVPNAYGAGEPLTLTAVENLVNAAYRQPDAQASLPYFERLGAAFLLGRVPLADARGYIEEQSDTVHIYRLARSPGLCETSGNGDPRGRIVAHGEHKTVLELGTPAESDVLWKEPFYPGWTVYTGRERVATRPGTDRFLEWRVPPGQHRMTLLYRPRSYLAGVTVTLCSLALLLLYGIRYRRSSQP